MSYRLCISDVLHYQMARGEAQHGTFSEPTRSGIHTTTQRGIVPSCMDVVHRRTRIAWLLVEAKRILFKHKEWSGCRPGIVGVDDDRDGCMALEGTALDRLESKTAKTHEAPVKFCCVYAKLESQYIFLEPIVITIPRAISRQIHTTYKQG